MCTKPSLVWIPKIPRDKEGKLHLDSCAETTDASSSLHPEQIESIHLYPPPQSSSLNTVNPKENPNLANLIDDGDDENMANFLVNLHLFLVGDLQIDHG
jgi:hypothetical protein